MNKKKYIPEYLEEFIKKYPKTKSGRKNFKHHHIRIMRTFELIKKYWDKSNN